MATQETCPHCGAAAEDSNFWTTIYECATAFESERTSTCYERQLAAKDAAINRLRDIVEMMTSHIEQKLRGEQKLRSEVK